MAASKVIELEMSEMTEKIEEPEKRISLFDLDSKSVRLLGEEILINANLLSRVKWGQRGCCAFGFLSLLTYISSNFADHSPILRIITSFFLLLALLSVAIMLHNNISLRILKRTFKEVNSIIIMLLAVFNLAMELIVPYDSVSWINGVVYLFIVLSFIAIDSIIVKSRLFALVVGLLFSLVNVWNIYNLSFGNWSNGVVFFSYTNNGEKFVVYRRPTQRSIFLQILLFSLNGIWVLIMDKKMRIMMFATAYVDKESGKAS